MRGEHTADVDLGPEYVSILLEHVMESLTLVRQQGLRQGIGDSLLEFWAKLHVVSEAGTGRTEVDAALREEVARRHVHRLFGLRILVFRAFGVLGVGGDAGGSNHTTSDSNRRRGGVYVLGERGLHRNGVVIRLHELLRKLSLDGRCFDRGLVVDGSPQGLRANDEFPRA